MVHSELLALFAELSDDFLDVPDIHLLVDLAHDVVHSLHGSHHFSIDLEGAQGHGDGTHLGFHLVHSLILVSYPDQIFRHRLGRTMLVLSGKGFDVLQALAFLFCQIFLLALNVTNGFVNYTLVCSRLILWRHFFLLVTHV